MGSRQVIADGSWWSLSETAAAAAAAAVPVCVCVCAVATETTEATDATEAVDAEVSGAFGTGTGVLGKTFGLSACFRTTVSGGFSDLKPASRNILHVYKLY